MTVYELPLFLMQAVTFPCIAVYAWRRRPRQDGKGWKSVLRFVIDLGLVALAGDKLVELQHGLYMHAYDFDNRLFGTPYMPLHHLALVMPYLGVALVGFVWYCVLQSAKPPHHVHSISETVADIVA